MKHNENSALKTFMIIFNLLYDWSKMRIHGECEELNVILG